MTIKEAVEYYNSINDEIIDIKEILKGIFEKDLDPLGGFRIRATDMDKIVLYLTEYIKVLEQKLQEEFK